MCVSPPLCVCVCVCACLCSVIDTVLPWAIVDKQGTEETGSMVCGPTETKSERRCNEPTLPQAATKILQLPACPRARGCMPRSHKVFVRCCYQTIKRRNSTRSKPKLVIVSTASQLGSTWQYRRDKRKKVHKVCLLSMSVVCMVCAVRRVEQRREDYYYFYDYI
jgi:hypothetical protein